MKNIWKIVACSVGVFLTSCLTTQPQNKSSQISTLSKTISTNQGPLIWFPFVWSAEIDSENIPKNIEVELRKVKILFTEKTTNNSFFINLTTNDKSPTSNVNLNATVPQKYFLVPSPSFFSLPEGTYTLDGIETEIVNPDTRVIQKILIPLNINNKPILFSSVNKKIALLPRTITATKIGYDKKNFIIQTNIEIIDKNVIPAELALIHAQKDYKILPNIIAASQDFRIRIPLRTHVKTYPYLPQDTPVAKVGFLVDFPCQQNGILNTIWKRTGDEREYHAIFPFSVTEKNCNKKTYPAIIEFTEGEWILRGTYVVDSNNTKEKIDIKTSLSKDIQSYLNMEYNSIIDNFQDFDIQKQILFRLIGTKNKNQDSKIYSSDSFDNSILYLGKIELNKQTSNNKSYWSEINWIRNYSLQELQQYFKAKKIYNAYTLSALSRERSLGKIDLRLSFVAQDPKRIEKITREIQKSANEYISTCFLERENIDPLITFSGSIMFRTDRNSQLLSLDALKIEADTAHQLWLYECMQKKFLAFRLSEKAIESIQGEIVFKLE